MKQKKKNNSFINLWKKSFFGTSFGTGAKHEFTCCARELEWARWSGSTYLRGGGSHPPAQISISHDWSYASHVWINILCLGGSRGGEEEGWAKLGCCLFRILWKYEGKFAILLVFHNYKICMRAVYIRCVRGVNSFMSECVRACVCARVRAPHACSRVCSAAPVTFSPQPPHVNPSANCTASIKHPARTREQFAKPILWMPLVFYSWRLT